MMARREPNGEWKTIRLVAARELLEIRRDGRLRLVLAVVLLLFGAAFATGWIHHRTRAAEQEATARQQRQQWLSQGGHDPHGAVDDGFLVVLPASPLASMDSGVEWYTGTVTLLTAHSEHLAKNIPAEDAPALLRIGQFTTASVLQLLIPLMLILIAYNVIAGERDQGTLAQLQVCAAHPRAIALGKLAAIALLFLLVLAPVTLAGIAALTASGTGSVLWSLPRLGVLLLAWLSYFSVFLCAGIAVSARANSSRLALLTLLGFWLATTLVAPRVAATAIRKLQPVPGDAEFQARFEEANRQKVDWDQLYPQVKEELLRQYHAAAIAELPVNPEGVALGRLEITDSRASQEMITALGVVHQGQDDLYEAFSVVSPLLAVQSISMAMSATDGAHFRHFNEAAERYRIAVVAAMNDDLARHSTWHKGIPYAPDPKLWASVPEFRYEPPSIDWAIRRHFAGIGILAGWAALSAVFLALAIRRFSVRCI